MTYFDYGIRPSFVVVGASLLIASLWWMARNVFNHLTAKIGWPVIVGVVVVPVGVVVIGKYLFATSTADQEMPDQRDPG